MAVNGLTPVPLESFSGIDWRDDPDGTKWNAAIDCFNVDLDPRGALRPRPAPALAIDTQLGLPPSSFLPYLTSTGAQQWIAGAGPSGRVDAYNDTGTLLGTGNFANTNIPYGMQAIGDPSGTRVYVGNGRDPIGYWNADGGAWVINSTMATVDGVAGKPMPIGHLLAATPWDNRLVVSGSVSGLTGGGPGGGSHTSSPSQVWFSEPANPWGSPASNVTDWKSTNYVILTPGDGEPINAMVVWNNQLFVFKRSKFFVFYGVSSDATGNPVFNYRTVNTGVGVDTRPDAGTSGLATAGPDGVYFAHASGIYRTSGGNPTRISSALKAAFPGGGDTYYPFYVGSAMSSYLPVWYCQDLAWRRDRLYVSIYGGFTNSYGMFVWDQALDAWMFWDIPARALRVFNDHLYCAKYNTTGIRDISANNNETMTCVYQSTFSQLGQDAREKTIRETQIVGRNLAAIGMQLGWARDSDDRPSVSAPSMSSLSGGTAGRFYQRQAEFGEKLSWRVSATGTQNSATWLVQRMIPMIRESVQGKARA